MLALQAEGPEFSPENPGKNARHGDTACNLSAGETETKGDLGLSASQSSLLGEPQASKRSCLENDRQAS